MDLELFIEEVLKIGSQQIEVNYGLPQGSCLSPILFNLYTRILHEIEDKNTLLYQYADDFIIISSNRSFKIAGENICQKVREFWDKCQLLNLFLNPNKAFSMYVARGLHKDFSVEIEGKRIKQVRSFRFLVRIINASLTVKEHYETVKNSMDNRLNLLIYIN